MRALTRMVMIERALREMAHGDMHTRWDTNEEGHNDLFPGQRKFKVHVYPNDPHKLHSGKSNESEIQEIGLLIHDLCVVWDGEKWEGDGACSFNKFECGRYKRNYDFIKGKEEELLTLAYLCPWPKRLTVMHSSWSPWGIVGERLAESRTHLPSVQNMQLFGMKPGDYLVGEMYLEIC